MAVTRICGIMRHAPLSEISACRIRYNGMDANGRSNSHVSLACPRGMLLAGFRLALM
jgi:hypothetical protein